MTMLARRTAALCAAALVGGIWWPKVGNAQQADTASSRESSCVQCHAGLGGALAQPVEMYAADVHARTGFGCVACHGGDAEEFSLNAMDPDRGYIGVPSGTDIPTVCGRCHSSADFMKRYDPSARVDQVAEYRTSRHGRLLYERGDTLVATCASCHTPHSIRPPSDPKSSVHPLAVAGTCGSCHADPEHMAPYGIPTDQVEKYHESIHWTKMSEEGDLSAPTCNDCHGNHGAAPPGVSWVGNVCGQCHAVMAEQFAASFHSEILTMLGSPGCATCHNNHAVKEAGDELLGVGEGTACGQCHAAEGSGGSVAMRMRALVDSLRTEIEDARAILGQAENSGMEVSEASFHLSDARTALVGARTAVHSFRVDSVAAAVETGLEVASAAYASGEEALDELQVRRMGLAVSVAIILVLIVGLVLKIRQIEEKPTVVGSRG